MVAEGELFWLVDLNKPNFHTNKTTKIANKLNKIFLFAGTAESESEHANSGKTNDERNVEIKLHMAVHFGPDFTIVLVF